MPAAWCIELRARWKASAVEATERTSRALPDGERGRILENIFSTVERAMRGKLQVPSSPLEIEVSFETESIEVDLNLWQRLQPLRCRLFREYSSNDTCAGSNARLIWLRWNVYCIKFILNISSEIPDEGSISRCSEVDEKPEDFNIIIALT